MTAPEWDSRYATAQQWSDEPNALAASLLDDVTPGRALAWSPTGEEARSWHAVGQRRKRDSHPRRFASGALGARDCGWGRVQVHCWAAGTPRMTCSTCCPHPDHVVLLHVRQVA